MSYYVDDNTEWRTNTINKLSVKLQNTKQIVKKKKKKMIGLMQNCMNKFLTSKWKKDFLIDLKKKIWCYLFFIIFIDLIK